MNNNCRICGLEESGKKLANHIKKEHGLSSLEYTLQVIYAGQRPTCQICGAETRYTSFKFMKFCAEHSSYAESEAGRKGGLAPAWNKGLTAETDVRIASMKGEANPFWGKQHTDETKQKISKSKRLNNGKLTYRLEQRSDSFEMLTTTDEYENRQKQYLEFACKICGNSNKKTLQAFERGSLCNACFPNTSSQQEIEIESWLKTLGLDVKRSDRSVISPKELDITIPDKQLAIEFDGLYWHSQLSKDNIEKSMHSLKTKMCLEKGWKLIHIFSDEWRDKKDIIKFMILHKLGIQQTRTHARSCKLKELTLTDRRAFFNENHLAGDVACKKSWGLIDSNGQIVSAISVRTPIQKKWEGRLEIARFAIKGGKHVPGALSKLLVKVKEFAQEEKKSGIISYADRRHGEGNCYQTAGFSHAGDTGIDYWYTNGVSRFDRFMFRANEGMSENERAQAAGVGKIWGCGNNVWLFDFVRTT